MSIARSFIGAPHVLRALIILFSYGVLTIECIENSKKKKKDCAQHEFESIRNRRQINRFCDGDSYQHTKGCNLSFIRVDTFLVSKMENELRQAGRPADENA